jgi:hypothetical protein
MPLKIHSLVIDVVADKKVIDEECDDSRHLIRPIAKKNKEKWP